MKHLTDYLCVQYEEMTKIYLKTENDCTLRNDHPFVQTAQYITVVTFVQNRSRPR